MVCVDVMNLIVGMNLSNEYPISYPPLQKEYHYYSPSVIASQNRPHSQSSLNSNEKETATIETKNAIINPIILIIGDMVEHS